VIAPQPIFPSVRPASVQKVVVVLIKPTHYDDQGFPYRFARGVLPSNSMAVMYALTRQALARLVPASVETEVHLLEDGIYRHAKQLVRLYRRFPESGTQLIVGLVAVQTAQFPRACDLIARWQACGATCVIGGFHVSGLISTLYDGVADSQRTDIPCPHRMPEDLQALISRGAVIFHGEAEERWAQVLEDILDGRVQPLYRGGQPDLAQAQLPEYPPAYLGRSFATAMRTVDTGRGCPFGCSFCTIINVQGRTLRIRDPAAVVEYLKQLGLRNPNANVFFTDDNFARNPRWEEILDGLSRERCTVRFMIQADLACGKIPGFLAKLAAAGCGKIFMGVESVNPKNLAEANKRQNQVDAYAQLWQRCHELDIVVHAAYIIGFSHDTAESVAQDVEQLARLGADLVSFYMLIPLPGSEDHARAVAAGLDLDLDYNRYDSCHATFPHPLMPQAAWVSAFARSWRQFYCAAHMVSALKRFTSRKERLNLLYNYIWYRWSVVTERAHPMIAGFYRFRPYRDRRPGAPPLPFWRYLLQEGWRHLRYVGFALSEFYRFQHVVFETEFAPMIAEKQSELSGRLHGIGDWFRRTFGRVMSRKWLNNFWVAYGRNRWRLLFPWAMSWHIRLLPYALTEVVYTVRFALLFLRIRRFTAS